MKPTFRLMLAGLLALTFYSPLHASGQNWTATSAPFQDWCSIASSADGSRLFVAGLYGDPHGMYGDIYSSTNGGQTWNQTSAPGNNWRSIACSADGATLIAANAPDDFEGGTVFLSHDFGGTWTQAPLPSYVGLNARSWSSVASSADGNRLVAVGWIWPGTNLIYVSSDSGGSWTPTDATNDFWSGVGCSADGMRLALIGSSGTWTSTNGGLNWNPTTTPFAGLSVAISADGNTLLVLNDGTVAVSHDWGANWITNSTPPNPTLNGTPKVASSADGTQLAAFAWGGAESTIQALLSTNAGLSWSNSVVDEYGFTNACSIACSADGRKFVLAVGLIFTYQTAPKPLLNLLSSGDNLVLSWIVPSQNFVLQQSSNLSTWSAVPVTPVLNYTNLHYEVTVSRTSGQRFYRLASP